MKKSNIVSVIVLLGSAGVGKGTLMDGALVGREAQFNAIATGNIIRSEVTAQTPLGQKAQTFMEAGLLVPDELINNMVIQAIKDSDKPVILDGFPRNLTQCQAMMDAGIIPTKVIFVQLDDEIIIKRLAKRVICKSCGKSYSLDGPKRPQVDGICDKCGSTLHRRKDDNPEIVLNRLEGFRKDTAPVSAFLSAANVPIFTVNNNHPGAQDEFTRLLFQ